VFLLVAKRKEATGGKCAFCGLTTNVKLVFETIGFDRILTVYQTRELALAQMQPLSQAVA
jgi:anti-anti-sigma regulatory factor